MKRLTCIVKENDMTVAISSRHFDTGESLKFHIDHAIKSIYKNDDKKSDGDWNIVISKDKNTYRSEISCNLTNGTVLHYHHSDRDPYTSFNEAFHKLRNRINERIKPRIKKTIKETSFLNNNDEE
jgi:ribosomal subunit interface protein